jgi:hypothetical protein
MRLRACNRDCSRSGPHAEADTRGDNCHTCDIHFSISAFSFSKKKRPSKGPGTNCVDAALLDQRGRALPRCAPRGDPSREARCDSGLLLLGLTRCVSIEVHSGGFLTTREAPVGPVPQRAGASCLANQLISLSGLIFRSIPCTGQETSAR